MLAGTVVGAAFLTWYGLRALRGAWVGGAALHVSGAGAGTPGAVVGTALGFSLLNPHALLDTVVLIGGASAGLGGGARLAFLAGTVLASWAWFFTLAPVMARPGAWRVLDALIGVTLLVTAVGLLLSLRLP